MENQPEPVNNEAVNLCESKQDDFKLEYIHSMFIAQTEGIRVWDNFVSCLLVAIAFVWGMAVLNLDFLMNHQLITKELLFCFAATSLFSFLWKYYLLRLSSSFSCMDKVREVIKGKAKAFFEDIQAMQKENPVLEAAQIIKAEDLKNLFISLNPMPARLWVQRQLKHSDPLIGYRAIGKAAQAGFLYMNLTVAFFILTLVSFLFNLIDILF